MSEPEPTFRVIHIQNPFSEFALMIMATRDDVFLPLGSGVIVAPYLAMTATHVISECHRQLIPGSDLLLEDDGGYDYQVYAFRYVSPSEWNMWKATKAVWSPYTDVCFLQLEPETKEEIISPFPDYPFKHRIKVHFSPPAVGDRIAGFGYPNSYAGRLDAQTIQTNIRPIMSTGVVTQVFEEHRDKSLLHFPCFEINARFDGGMSGGPVFNVQGECCGVICACLPMPDGSHVSYASVLWPELATKLPFDMPYLIYQEPYPLIDLCRVGMMPSSDWQKFEAMSFDVEVDPLGSGKQRIKLK